VPTRSTAQAKTDASGGGAPAPGWGALPAGTGSFMAGEGAAIPPTTGPGKAEQPCPLVSRSFVQWGAPPGHQGARLLHCVWADGRRDGSGEGCGFR